MIKSWQLLYITGLDWIICIRVTPASMVDLNFRPPNWLGWMKSLVTTWNWILSSMTFSISLFKVLSKTIGLNDLGESYDDLFGLGMITVDDLLKWFGQYPKSMQAFAILMMLVMQTSSVRIILRWFHDNLSGSGVNKLLHLFNAILNSSFENGTQAVTCLFPISSRILILTWRWKVMLKEKWRAFYKLSSERQGQITKSWIILFPTVFTLKNIKVFVDTTDSGNIFTNIKMLVDNYLSFGTVLWVLSELQRIDFIYFHFISFFISFQFIFYLEF